MSLELKRILASAGVFLGVLLIMCLAAKFVIKTNADLNDGVIRDGSDSLSSGNSAGNKDGGDGAGKGNTESGSINSGENGNTADGNNGKSGNGDSGNNAGDPGKNNADGGSENTGSNTGGTDREGQSGDNGGNGTSGQNDGNGQAAGTTGSKSSFIVCIDAAHQQKDDSSSEPIGPGAEKTKVKCTTGATGVSGLLEYEFTLTIAQKLKAELLSRGYGVIMTRETHDVNISDATRAKNANESASIAIHIHGNADERPAIAGVMTFEPSEDNPYVKGSLREKCSSLGQYIVDKLAAATSTKNWGVITNDNLSALNWTTIPASHVEVGYLTNADEEKMLKTEDYQNRIVKGIADGIDAFYEANH
ncbi:MAG: N-acetylmuramoyl-L-alanine amidase [Lachnospiraceae bacterium]|nr:N-acetylmuramoyl-L-alanine amidase [Lachnospiraceae bacterium]